MSAVALPGQVIASTSTHFAGSGTHVRDNNILASIVGSTITTPSTNKSSKPTISIPRDGVVSNTSLQTKSNSLPTVGSVVLCRVIRVQQRQLTATILIVNPSASSVVSYTATTNDELQFQALLRKEDIRAYEKDKIVMNEMFRIGDIIKATIISLGDERSYYISTVGNEYGVVVAKSEAGNAMIPTSWKEMKDVVTGKGESRKVAKPA